MGDPAPTHRRTFGPVVLAGLAGSALAAVAGTKDWVSTGQPQAVIEARGEALDAPGVTALALVVLAAWGAALVTRGRLRRVILGLAALGALAALPVAWSSRQGLPAGPTTAWPWLGLAGVLVALACGVAAVRLAPGWPEMGRRYDAPTTAEAPAAPLEEQSNLDLWRSIGEGHDPTADRTE